MRERLLKIDFFKIFRALILFLSLIIVISMVLLPNYTKIKRLKEEKAALLDKIEKVKKEIVNLREDIKSLDKPFYLEKFAREELGIIKENEAVLDIKR